jgi:hypothetical protein
VPCYLVCCSSPAPEHANPSSPHAGKHPTTFGPVVYVCFTSHSPKCHDNLPFTQPFPMPFACYLFPRLGPIHNTTTPFLISAVQHGS